MRVPMGQKSALFLECNQLYTMMTSWKPCLTAVRPSSEDNQS
jgi:hypothetical protein